MDVRQWQTARLEIDAVRRCMQRSGSRAAFRFGSSRARSRLFRRQVRAALNSAFAPPGVAREATAVHLRRAGGEEAPSNVTTEQRQVDKSSLIGCIASTRSAMLLSTVRIG